MRIWRNWQTRMVQVHMNASSCRFKSCYPHQTESERNSRSDSFFGAFRRRNTPLVLPWEEKSFRMRLSEGKQILESKRLNKKEIGKE